MSAKVKHITNCNVVMIYMRLKPNMFLFNTTIENQAARNIIIVASFFHVLCLM